MFGMYTYPLDLNEMPVAPFSWLECMYMYMCQILLLHVFVVFATSGAQSSSH